MFQPFFFSYCAASFSHFSTFAVTRGDPFAAAARQHIQIWEPQIVCFVSLSEKYLVSVRGEKKWPYVEESPAGRVPALCCSLMERRFMACCPLMRPHSASRWMLVVNILHEGNRVGVGMRVGFRIWGREKLRPEGTRGGCLQSPPPTHTPHLAKNG